jgi:hypothetical protein
VEERVEVDGWARTVVLVEEREEEVEGTARLWSEMAEGLRAFSLASKRVSRRRLFMEETLFQRRCWLWEGAGEKEMGACRRGGGVGSGRRGKSSR